MKIPARASLGRESKKGEGSDTRTGIVRERTAADPMKALEERMNANVKRAGSVEFAAIFDEVAR